MDKGVAFPGTIIAFYPQNDYTAMKRLLFACLLMASLTSLAQDIPCPQAGKAYSYKDVEVKPGFNGSLYNFSKWINANLHYPEELNDSCFDGRIIVSFIINDDGSISNVHVKHGLHPLLDAEAIRVISMSPKWTPGMIEGKKVKTDIMFPVIFPPSPEVSCIPTL
ncbi:MAG: energy transducer TonB [Bacteroidales bacterium]|nr:energy transducer TonB [Bacteroidales bacterium]